MAEVADWEPVDDDNDSAPPVGWPEGMLPSEVNNAARAMQGALRREHDRVVDGTLSLPYLPLAGGVLTGAVTATSITASGTLQAATLTSTGNINASGETLTINSANSPRVVLHNTDGTYKGIANSSNLLQFNLMNSGGGISAILGYFDASGNFSASGGMTSATNITAVGTVTAAQLTSTGNINATGIVFGETLSASGTVVGAYVHSTGNVQADNAVTTPTVTASGTITGAQLTSTGNINASLDIGCRDISLRDVHSSRNIGVVGDMTAASVNSTGNLAAVGSITGASLRSTATLQVDTTSALLGTASFGPAGAWARIDTNGTYNVSGSWLTLSDRAVKENILPYTRGLDAILALNPVTYVYKAGSSFSDAARTVRLGLVAQDVELVMPELVGKAKSEGADVATLAPGNLVYALVNAVKELTARVTVLEGGKV